MGTRQMISGVQILDTINNLELLDFADELIKKSTTVKDEISVWEDWIANDTTIRQTEAQWSWTR